MHSTDSEPSSRPCPDPAWLHRPLQPLAGTSEGPLQGLTFAVKDNIDVAGWPTTAACPQWSRTASRSATVVRRLLEAGATLVGKTNMDQFACGLNGTRSPYGAVANAFDPAYISGGSSSGSARVVALGEVDFALGTDTAGSGRVPAGLNNIVGLKPSKGLISAAGVLPAAQSVDCVSIFAQTVPLAWRVLQVAAGYDPLDPFSVQRTFNPRPWNKPWRFGVPRVLDFDGDELSRRQFDLALRRLQELGGTPVVLDDDVLQRIALMLYESALVAERYAAIRTFFDAHPEAVIEPVRTIIGQGRSYSAADLHEAQLTLRVLSEQAQSCWEWIDFWCVPTASTHYRIDQMQADPLRLNRNLGRYTNFVNLLDWAALAVPSGLREDGLPFGVTLIGPAGSDAQLAQVGACFHAHAGLALGATNQRLSNAEFAWTPFDAPEELPTDAAVLAVAGAHLSGMPLNHQLTDRGATRLIVTQTAPRYRLYALHNTQPPKPGLVRCASHESGAAIEVELWSMPLVHWGSFMAGVPAPLAIGQIELADGRWVHGFVCESHATQGATDITHLQGWRAHVTQQARL